MPIICKICGAENEGEGGLAERCHNCDNDLPGYFNGVSRPGEGDRVGDPLNRTFAAFYALVFILGLGCYVLSKFDNDPAIDPLAVPLTIIAVFHVIVIKRVDEIKGFYKGPNRFNILRGALLFGIIGLILFEVATTEGAEDKNKVFYLVMMAHSLMLFYTYCFGKKSSGLNYFNLFYDASANLPQGYSGRRSKRRRKS